MELAKRNAARQLLPLPEIKALEYKAKLEGDFDWEREKAKCLEIVPEYTLSIIIDDLVRDGTLRQAHPSDYSQKEWLLIFDAVKKDPKDTMITSENVYGGRKIRFEIDTVKPNWVTIHYSNGRQSTTYSQTIYETVLQGA